MNYITQEQAEAIATKYALPQGLGKPHWPVIFNEVIKHYIDSRPAPPRPVYGAVGTKDTEVAAAMAQWDAQYAQPAKPLTDEEISTIYGEAKNQTLRSQDQRLALAFARAIEKAHKIGGSV
jgi:hypothetical protein